jgi:hypothetical protein
MSDGQLVAAAEAVYSRLHNSLSRSIGQTGYLALVTRAMSEAREQHSALGVVKLGGPPGPWLVGVDRMIQEQGNEAATEAMVDVLAELIELLTRFVGPTFSTRLIRAAWPEPIQGDKTSRHPEEQNG